jgi:hypothetical protein
MFIPENYNPYDSLLFDMACRESLCLMVDLSSVPHKKELKRYITKEASSYEVLSFVIGNQMPKENHTIEDERLLFEQFKTMLLINKNEISPYIGESVIQEIISNVDTLSILTEADAANPQLMTGVGNTAVKALAGSTIAMSIRHFFMSPMSAGVAALVGKLSTAIAGLGVAALVALMAYASYKVYKNFLSKAAKACSDKEGTEKKMCMKEFEIQGISAQLADMRKGLSACSKSKDPEKCREALNKKMQKVKEKLDKARTNI